ncbi:hypothetical protein V8F20_000617 [Naviculisporaceae sp. PSN 640]
MSEMEIDPDEGILNRAAQDGSMNYSAWPGLLPALIERIEKTAHNDFPIPSIPPPKPPVRPPSPRLIAPLPSSDTIGPPSSSGTTPSSQETNKENANPASLPPGTTVNNVAPPTSTAVASTENPPTQQGQPAPGALPPQVTAMLDEITSTLKENFENYPPHTIQRLSELVLRPRQHYRHLVAYLHAVDRVVHVTSGANTYPLPPAVSDMSAMSSNGGGGSVTGLTINSTVANNLGTDEALGGALLTPIPWLSKSTNGGGSDDVSDAGSSSPLSSGPVRPQQQQLPQSRQIGPGGRKPEPQLRTESTETIEGPNGMGSIETVTISLGGLVSTSLGSGLANRGVTQGNEFLQGATPSSQHIKDEKETPSDSEEKKEPETSETPDSKADEGSSDKGGDNPMEGVEPAEVKEEETPTADAVKKDEAPSEEKSEPETDKTE